MTGGPGVHVHVHVLQSRRRQKKMSHMGLRCKVFPLADWSPGATLVFIIKEALKKNPLFLFFFFLFRLQNLFLLNIVHDRFVRNMVIFGPNDLYINSDRLLRRSNQPGIMLKATFYSFFFCVRQKTFLVSLSVQLCPYWNNYWAAPPAALLRPCESTEERLQTLAFQTVPTKKEKKILKGRFCDFSTLVFEYEWRIKTNGSRRQTERNHWTVKMQ